MLHLLLSEKTPQFNSSIRKILFSIMADVFYEEIFDSEIIMSLNAAKRNEI